MVLSFNKIQINYFNDIVSAKKKIGVSFSGGIDSSLALYCLAYTINEYKQYDVMVYPYHMKNTSLKHLDTTKNAYNVLEYITKKFPEVNIQPMFIVASTKQGNKSKAKFGIYALEKLLAKVKLDHVIVGQHQEDTAVIMTHDDKTRDLELNTIKSYPQCYPWKDVGKAFIRAQYKTLDIEDMSLLTNSCVADNPLGRPCRKCHWCVERYEHFGSYDYGLNV